MASNSKSFFIRIVGRHRVAHDHEGTTVDQPGVIRARIESHFDKKDFWNKAIVFVSSATSGSNLKRESVVHGQKLRT
jgi:hypothetical protein